MAAKRKTRFAILGLLSWKPMSGYDIKKLIEMGLQYFWNESYGQLYPTLEALVAEGLAVRKAASTSGGRRRHLYTITAKGRRTFLDWLRKPTDLPKLRSEPQLKFFLASRLPVEEGVRLVEEYRAQQRERLQLYKPSEQILRRAVRNDVWPEELEGLIGPDEGGNELLMFLLTLRQGILVTEARLTWCDEALKSLRARGRRRSLGGKSK